MAERLLVELPQLPLAKGKNEAHLFLIHVIHMIGKCHHESETYALYGCSVPCDHMLLLFELCALFHILVYCVQASFPDKDHSAAMVSEL